jgi:ComF family protein
MSRLFNPILDFFYPPRCLVCQKAGAVIHPHCRPHLNYLAGNICPICSHYLSEAEPCQSSLCRLPPDERYLDCVKSVFVHEGGAREAVLKLKYEGVRALREWLNEELATTARYYGLHNAAAIVAVPLHPNRKRERGYNQAEILAQDLAEKLNLPLGEGWLVRSRLTRTQVGLNGTERRVNVEGAFSWQTAPLKNHTILIVDDVCTTGATLNACASALKSAGAGAVWALTVTRELGAREER